MTPGSGGGLRNRPDVNGRIDAMSGSGSVLSSGSMRDLLDPEVRGVIENYVLPPAGLDGLGIVRNSSLRDMVLSGSVSRADLVVGGDPAVPVRVHRPVDQVGLLPAVVTIHGGGLVFGSYDMDTPLLDRWCTKFGLIGISVDYRLAPENPYPAALDDCYNALRWANDHSEELGIDRTTIGLYGISAGGGLAASTAVMARDHEEVSVAFQILDTPMIDDRQFTTSPQGDGAYVWNREWNEFGWRSYLASMYGSVDVPPYAAAARTEDLRGLPPAFMAVGSIDGFRDQDVEYAMRLNQAGVPCELHVFAGLPHGYGLVPEASGVQLAAVNMECWLARRLATDGRP
jgi:acetyl esterase/lipase